MRTVLVTGKGGAGRSTAAAATAVLAARTGLRTLLLSTDPHRSIEHLLETAVGTEPTGIEDNLFAARLDEQEAFREETLAVQQRIGPALEVFGVEPLEPEELTALPGSAEVVLLRALRQAAESEAWDVLIADCPETPRLLAALALPEQLLRYLRRVLPGERQAARALRPVLAAVVGVPMPAEWIFDAKDWLEAELAALQAVPEDPGTTLRLVVPPGALAVKDLRRARAGAALFGHRVDAVLANRVLPEGSADPWLSTVASSQHADLKEVRAECARPEEAAVPVYELPHSGDDPYGTEELAALAATTYGAVPGPVPRPVPRTEEPFTVTPAEEGEGADRMLLLRMPLPGADRTELELDRVGDELLIGVGPYRRMLPLPSGLRRCTVVGAALREGMLSIRFRPDPGLWPVR